METKTEERIFHDARLHADEGNLEALRVRYVRVDDLIPSLRAARDNDKTVYTYDGENSKNSEGFPPMRGKRYNTPREIIDKILVELSQSNDKPLDDDTFYKRLANYNTSQSSPDSISTNPSVTSGVSGQDANKEV